VGTDTRLVLPLPSDVAVLDTGDAGGVRAHRARPVRFEDLGLAVGVPRGFASLPVVTVSTRAKVQSGWWHDHRGWADWAGGGVPRTDSLVRVAALWRTEPRLGIALDEATRTVR